MRGGPFAQKSTSSESSHLLHAAVAYTNDAPYVIPPQRARLLDAAAAGATLGVGLWVTFDILFFPIITGGGPQWSGAGMRAVFGHLAGWLLTGSLAGVFFRAYAPAWATRLASARPSAPRVERSRIVIVGGGFAGITAAKALERRFGADPDVELTLISDTNALLFTPMLSEVAGSSLEAAHISSPARTSLHRTDFVRGHVTAIDPGRRTVTLDAGELAYDHLVLATGAVSNYLGLRGVERWSLDFKTLLDALAIRNRVIEMFERADRLSLPQDRTPLLTFLIAGGGFAGAELAGALNDFARGIVVDYPHILPDEVHIVLVHARDRILPELSESLANYALERMRARGVTFRLGARVSDATADSVTLDSGETIAAHTLVWTAGTAPSTLVRDSGLPCDKRGAAIVDATLAVADYPGVWAIGDCAAVKDAKTGTAYPPTAQFAIREAQTLARNLHATIRRKKCVPFAFISLGALCVVGHQTACAELRVPLLGNSVRFSGFAAWLAWRAIYLAKLPGIERKLRVFVDWNLELFFPRDIVQTIELHS